MIKKLRVTVDGKSYDLTVEVADEPGAPAAPGAPPPPPAAPPPVSAPVAPAPSAVPASPAAAASSSASAGPGDVHSPLAVRIIAINVQPGQEVKEGDHLLTV